MIKTNNSELFISSRIAAPLNITTTNAYQQKHGGGANDIYINIIKDDGKDLKYGTYYGLNGSENAVALPTLKGFYVIGYSQDNISKDATLIFASNHNGTKKDFSYHFYNGYWGNFLSYFTTEALSTESINTNNVSIYPNPATDVLNIQFKDIVPESTVLTIYDVAGKKVLSVNSQPTDLNQINISNLNSGVYILQIDGSNINQSVKFIKK